MREIRLFWWAPFRNVQMAIPELRSNPSAWLRLAGLRGRVGRNFGDELSPLVLEAATGKKVKWARPESAEAVAIGSVLELYGYRGRGAVVWGSGLRQAPCANEGEIVADRLGPVLAVRGPRTADALGSKAIHAAQGDPGVLAPMLIGSRSGAISRPTVVIPHFRVFATRDGLSHLRECKKRGLTVLPPTLHPIEMASSIRDAAFVLTSSLHGLILAHAFGVPAQLVTFTQAAQQEPDFKYRDYLASVSGAYSSVRIQDAAAPNQLQQLYEVAHGGAAELEGASNRLAGGLLRAASAF